MGNLALVLERIQAGDRVRFFNDYYGRQWVELSRGWLALTKVRIDLSPQEILQLKAALKRSRADSREDAAAHALDTSKT